MLRDIKKMRIAAAVTVLVSLLAVFVVYSFLNRPGVAMTTADCISYDAEGYPVVTIPEDAEAVYTNQSNYSGYNCKYTLYNADDGYIMYLEPIDPAKPYVVSGLSYRDGDRPKIKAIKAAPGLTKISNTFNGLGTESFSNLVTADFSECPELTSMPDHVFRECKNLESINFAQDCALQKIGLGFFTDCTSLKSFPFSKLTNLKSIVTNNSSYPPFKNCPWETVDLSANINLSELNWSFYGCSSLKTVILPETFEFTFVHYPFSNGAIEYIDASGWQNFTEIPDAMFSNCSSLKTLILPDTQNITRIGRSAFYGCTALDIDLSRFSNVETVEDSAFSGCTSLTNVDFSGYTALKSIGNSAFSGCTSLTNVDFSGCTSLETIGNSAFYKCTSLTKVDISDLISLKAIPYQMFAECSNLETVIFSEDNVIDSIGQWAFNRCTALKDFPFEILSNVETIKYGAFASCSLLTEADMSSWTNLKELSGFGSCSSLETVKIPKNSSITVIGESAFSGCSQLKYLPFCDMPHLKTIGRCAFGSTAQFPSGRGSGLIEADFTNCPELEGSINYWFCGCPNLEKVDFVDNCKITSIDGGAFYQCPKLTYIPLEKLPNIKSIQGYKNAHYYTHFCFGDSFKNQKADLTNAKLEIISNSGLNYFKELDCTGLESLTSVTGSFSSAKLTKVSFKDCINLTSIPDFARSYSLTFVDLSGCSSLIELPKNMFNDCPKLTTVKLDGCSSLKALPDNIFGYNNTSSSFNDLKTVELDGCDSLETIGNKAFYKCRELTEITLPSGLTTIGNNAFEGCGKLQAINYNAENLTSVGIDAFKNLGATKNLTVNIGANVDTVCEGVFAENIKIKTVNFKGPNESLVIGKDAFKSCGKPLAAMSDGVTEYYVDENGVVYSKDKSTLYYVPAGIETFTVPAHVTTVKSNCIAKAADLKTLAFEDISTLTKVESNAFANRPTLTSVTAGGNTATTVKDAEALFAADTAVGREPFYNTGLKDGDFTGELTSGMVKDTTYTIKDGKQAVEYELSLYVNLCKEKDTGRNIGNLGTLDESCIGKEGKEAPRVPSVDKANINKDVYYYLTQEDANLTVALSSSSANVDKCGRVYFKCSNDAVLLHNYDVDKTVKISTSGGEGDKIITYDVTLRRVEDTDIYYLEFPALHGGTLGLDLSLYVPNLTEQNTTVKTWVQLCDSMDSPLNLTPENYQELHWYTAIHKTVLDHKTNNTIFNFKLAEDADGNKKVVIGNDITFNTTDTITTSNVDGYGIDPVRTIGYSQYFTLPEGIEWGDWVKEAINAGKWYASGGSVKLETENGDIELMKFNSSWTARDIDLKWDDEKGVVLSWKRLNPNLGASSGGSQSQEIDGLDSSFTFNADEIFKINESVYDFSKKSTITSNISNSIEHVFAEDRGEDRYKGLFEQNSSASATLGVAKPELQIKKSRDPLNSANQYGGEECDWIIEVTNNGIVEGNYSFVYDELPYNLTMRAEHIEKMFAEYGNVLQLTINHVYCNTATKEQTVIDSDGNKKVIDRNDVGTNADLTKLPEFRMENKFGSRSSTVWCDIAFRTEDGGKTLIVYMRDTSSKDYSATISYTIGAGCDYASVQDFFDAIGFVDYSNVFNPNNYSSNQTHYRCDWLEEPSGDNQINAGETRTYHIYSEFKHIFENEYQNNVRSWSKRDGSNVAFVWYHNDFLDDWLNYKRSDSVLAGYKTDFEVYKTYSSNGKSSPKELAVGDVVDYKAEIRKFGTDVYDTLPVYDTLSGSQAILVPVEGNEEALYIESDDRA